MLDHVALPFFNILWFDPFPQGKACCLTITSKKDWGNFIFNKSIVEKTNFLFFLMKNKRWVCLSFETFCILGTVAHSSGHGYKRLWYDGEF